MQNVLLEMAEKLPSVSSPLNYNRVDVNSRIELALILYANNETVDQSAHLHSLIKALSDRQYFFQQPVIL